MAKQIVLIHGLDGTNENHWFPYVKQVGRERGWEVIAPSFPGGLTPNVSDWLQTFKEEVAVTSETILVSHSLGCPFIMSLLESSDIKVAKVVCVAGLYNKERFSDLDFLQNIYDWEKIKKHSDSFTFLNSTNDPYNCDEAEADFAFSKLGGTKIIMENMGHFGTSEFNEVCTELPILIKLLEE